MRKARDSDPYNGFRDDRERRRALNIRSFCWAAGAIGVAWSGADGAPAALRGLLRSLLAQFV